MEIKEKFKNSLKLLSLEKFELSFIERLAGNCSSILSHGIEYPDVINNDTESECFETKELQAALLYIYAEFVRHNKTSEDFLDFLSNDIKVKPEKTKICVDFYRKYFSQIRINLLNIGSHLPHITDVRWKIDHMVKSNLGGPIEGPLFRISLKTEKYDKKDESSKIEFINFTCTSQELQDLVFKLKDAVRHTQKLAAEH